jgi:putative two-component system response regulator
MELKIMIIDDSLMDIAMIETILSDYKPLVAYDGEMGMELLNQNMDTDLIILDLNMPKMNGFQVLRELKKDPKYAKIITIILTNYDELENEILGLELGAIDYIRKPINIESLRKRVEIHGRMKLISKELERSNEVLETMVQERTRELVLTRDITIHALIALLEVRDLESGNHAKRTQTSIKALCEQLVKDGYYVDVLTPQYIQELYDTSPLHDIGKVGTPDHILHKPGKLTPEEFEIIKKHTTYGIEALRYEVPDSVMPSFVKTAIEFVSGHHEKYDGSGYPAGLKDGEIPLPGRLMAIVDVYDALISKRVYKDPIPHDEAMKMIIEQRGKHFDPLLVDTFVKIEEQIKQISLQFMQ